MLDIQHLSLLCWSMITSSNLIVANNIDMYDMTTFLAFTYAS